MGRVLQVAAVVVALLAFHFLQTPIPPGCKEPFKTRVMVYMLKVTSYPQLDLNSVLYGASYAYHNWVIGSRAMPYEPKPDREINGVQIRDVRFNHVPVRIHRPLTARDGGPGVLFTHGGGFMIGSVESYEEFCQEMSKDLNMVVVSVEYRLAPEHPYPIPFLDCVGAATHFIQHAEEYDVDPARIALVGDSAGGNLAAALSLKLRDLDITPQPRLQVLIYPMLQALDFRLPSMRAHTNDPVVRTEMIALSWLMYAQGSPAHVQDLLINNHTPETVKNHFRSVINHDIITGQTDTTPPPTDGNEHIWTQLKAAMLDPYFAPLVSDDLSDLPQALVYTAIQDPLNNDGVLYAHRLRAAGVQVEHYNNEAAFHALNSLGTSAFNSTDMAKSNTYIRNFIKKNI